MKICAITNVYNEAHNLPLWISHYRRQIGDGTLLVVDHGSDDGSTDRLSGDVSVIRLKRSLFDDNRRAMVIGDLARSMLREFDAVIYTDADELLIADPDKYDNLHDMIEQDERVSFTAIGLNVIHMVDREGPFEAGRTWLDQRRHVRFVSPMCKTVITKRALRWSGGFHYSDAPVSFGGLYLFHMRWADRGQNLHRLLVTRNVEWKRSNHETYQKASDDETQKRFQSFLDLPVTDESDFLFTEETSRLVQAENVVNALYRIPQDVRPRQLHLIPERFRSIV